MHKYYILISKDNNYKENNAGEGTIKISITTENKEKPFLMMEGKGHGLMGARVSIKDVKELFINDFIDNGITWIIDFVEKNPNFNEKELEKILTQHQNPLITERY